MKEWARSFYLSTAWQNCRNNYVKRAGGLCERCLTKGLYVPGEIVHHKTHLTPANIHDERITLNPDNLELLCRDCHGQEHGKIKRRYKVDECGRISPLREKNETVQ